MGLENVLDETSTPSSGPLYPLATTADSRFVSVFRLPLGRIAASIGSFRPTCTQTRHLARIFTVDFRKWQALNSWRWVSNSATTSFFATQWVRSQHVLA